MGIAAQRIHLGNNSSVQSHNKTQSKKPVGHKIKRIRDQVDNEPSIVPVALGISSIVGAFIGCMWQATRFASPFLGTFGTILLLAGAHFSGENPVKSIKFSEAV